jgi:hypothetical protein
MCFIIVESIIYIYETVMLKIDYISSLVNNYYIKDYIVITNNIIEYMVHLGFKCLPFLSLNNSNPHPRLFIIVCATNHKIEEITRILYFDLIFY